MAKGKSFKDTFNPAMQFISTDLEPELKTNEFETKEIPEGYRMNPLYIENKSRRVQLLMKPSLYEKIKEHAATENKSVNEWINSVLETNLE